MAKYNTIEDEINGRLLDDWFLFIRQYWWVGLVLVMGVYLYDPLMTGIRKWYSWDLGWRAHLLKDIGLLWLMTAIAIGVRAGD